ncbi:MAG: hypothetical protein IJ532_04975 [Alphaproteobacteria bacterium]|nr:hypothetical protein [Alphaproteobacteria bacterium]
MTDKKNTEGLKFILKLDMMADDEKKLVQLAKEAIDDSHDKRTFLERKNQDLRVNPTSINLGAAIGSSHAIMNNNLSTNDKLYMIMNKYIKLVQQKNPKMTKDKALDNFCKVFSAEFPNEYGVKTIERCSVDLNKVMLKRDREII